MARSSGLYLRAYATANNIAMRFNRSLVVTPEFPQIGFYGIQTQGDGRWVDERANEIVPQFLGATEDEALVTLKAMTDLPTLHVAEPVLAPVQPEQEYRRRRN